MAVLNYAELYLQALQQRYAAGLCFTSLYDSPNNENIRWVNAKTIQIPRITVSGYVDVDRDVVGSYTRRADNDWETKTLAHDREFSTLVDPQDIDETNIAVSIANITRVFNDEHKIPEMDKYMASKVYTEYLKYGGVAKGKTLTDQNILGVFDTLMEEMDDDEVPQNGRILYVTPAVNTLLKTAEKLYRTLEVRGEANVNRFVRSLDDVRIVIVPSRRMKTLYDFTTGAVADDDALQISMILIHPTAIISPQKYDFVSLDEPSATTGGKWFYYERKYWDIFAIEKKVAGIKIVVAADGNVSTEEDTSSSSSEEEDTSSSSSEEEDTSSSSSEE